MFLSHMRETLFRTKFVLLSKFVCVLRGREAEEKEIKKEDDKMSLMRPFAPL